MERGYLLITKKVLSWTFRRWEIRSFFEPKSWWKDDIYLVFLSFPWYSRTLETVYRAMEHYFGQITGTIFDDIVDWSFGSAFENSINPVFQRFLMDGCPRQNSRIALRAIARIGKLVFKIPPRNLDLNPIENVFNLVVQKLNNEAIEKDITDETFQSFSERVKRCMLSFPVKVIDKIISTMEKRINMVLKAKGQRIKY